MLHLGAGWRAETSSQRPSKHQLAVGAPVRHWEHWSSHRIGSGCGGAARGAWLGVELVVAVHKTGYNNQVMLWNYTEKLIDKNSKKK